MSYHGEVICEGILRNGNCCTNVAYYKCDNNCFCGVHSKKINRVDLPVNPNKADNEKREIDRRNRIVGEMRNKNGSGKVIVSKLRMFKKADHNDGYIKVFPNYKDFKKAEVLCCRTLSPKYMGPIEHAMPNLPPSKSLENYHQYAKVFPCEVDSNGNPNDEYLPNRIKGYESDTPMRHKYKGVSNIPLYSIQYDINGNEHRYTYLESRYFYCYWYTRFALRDSNFDLLKNKIKEGYNLQICGYDGYDISKTLYEHYLDTSRPFGHELVLYFTYDG